MYSLKFKMKYLTLLFLLIWANSSSFGQQFHFKKYSLEEGLSRSGVYHILQDHYGFLWIATDGGGICKFDGVHFKNFTRQHGLASEKVRIIFEDKNKVLWFGTNNGLSFFNGEQFETLTTEDGLSDNFIRSITQDKAGNLWVGTNRGISIIDPSIKQISEKLKINFTLPHRKTRSLLADTINDIIWIGTDAGLCKWDNSEITIINKKDGLIDNTILSMFLDSKNKLWVGTNNGLASIVDTLITNWTEKDGLINNRIRSINEDSYHNIWLGTKTGISVFDKTNFLNISVKNGLSNERIRCIQKDKFDNIWLGTYFGGIMRFNYKDFIGYTPKDGLISNQILCITEDDKGDIIIGTFDGASKLKIENNKLQNVKHVTMSNGLTSNNVQTIFKDNNGYYWYGTDAGISIVKDDKIITIGEQLNTVSKYITCIKYYNEKYYIGTHGGIAELQINPDYSIKNINFLTNNDGLAGKEVSFIEKDTNNRIWIGFSDGQISILYDHQLVNPVLPKTINEITSIAFDSTTRVWLGTNGRGIYYGNYDSKSKTLNLKNISTSNQLSSNYIFSLLHHKNKIWVGNEKGIDLINFSSDTIFNIQAFGPERGFLGLQNNQNSSYIDKKGNLWFGTVNGLFQLKNRESNIYSDGQKSISYIKTVSVNRKFTDWKTSKFSNGVAGLFNLPLDLNLPHDYNNLAFDFIALNYVASEKILYTWKLNGYDKDWSHLSQKKDCEYTNLEPGNYTLQIKSTNEKGVLMESITSFSFSITKPFWNTWGFRILTILIVIGLIIFYLNYRTKQLIIKQKDLEKVIAIRTEEITKQKDELELTKQEIELQNVELQLKNKEITDSILYSRRIQHSILPSLEKTNQLLKNYSIFYKPKDIVSGDFYWIEKSPINENKIFFAVADCTGHGVSGAMVSLICTRALNSSLFENRLDYPNQILDETAKIVTESFTDSETGTIIKDGMDIALGSLDYSQNTNHPEFEFSGAQNPAWIITPIETENIVINGNTTEPEIVTDTHKLFIVKATKQPVGHFENTKPFANNNITLPSGARIYFFTDGYADQFGGDLTLNSQGKKYKYKPLKKFIMSIQHHSITRQKLDLENEFYDWKQDLEQVDDVLFIAIEV